MDKRAARGKYLLRQLSQLAARPPGTTVARYGASGEPVNVMRRADLPAAVLNYLKAIKTQHRAGTVPKELPINDLLVGRSSRAFAKNFAPKEMGTLANKLMESRHVLRDAPVSMKQLGKALEVKPPRFTGDKTFDMYRRVLNATKQNFA